MNPYRGQILLAAIIALLAVKRKDLSEAEM